MSITKNPNPMLPSARVQTEMLKQVPPCWGHYAKMNCMNQGFLKYERGIDGIQHFKKCPFEASCRKKTLQYAKDSDPYNQGAIDKPREWIREIEKRS